MKIKSFLAALILCLLLSHSAFAAGEPMLDLSNDSYGVPELPLPSLTLMQDGKQIKLSELDKGKPELRESLISLREKAALL